MSKKPKRQALMSENSAQVNQVDELRSAIDTAYLEVKALGLIIAILGRTTRDAESITALGRLSVTCGEFVDRLNSTSIDVLRKA